MPRKQKRRRAKKEAAAATQYPFVSVCTPTFNRRPFIPALIACFKAQDYPADRMEWLVYDDGTDSVKDLLEAADIPSLRYHRAESKVKLGAKRNLLHHKAKGDIIVYMDDDDYYPSTRVSHAVETLKANPTALAAGCSELHLYFTDRQEMHQFGPYRENHATAATFALRRTLLSRTRYDPHACVAEEKEFLRNYTVPLVQLDPTKTILAFAHQQSTFDKTELLGFAGGGYVKRSPRKLEDFGPAEAIRPYIDDIAPGLGSYEQGSQEHKKDTLVQLDKLREMRDRRAAQAAQRSTAQQRDTIIEMRQPDGSKLALTSDEVVHILQMQQRRICELTEKLGQDGQQERDSDGPKEATAPST